MLCARNFRFVAVALPAIATALWIACFGQSSSLSKKSAASDTGQVAAWPYYGGDPGGSRYSPLTQINRSNVQELKVAWVYHTGDVSDGTKHPRKSAFETTPIMVDGTLYFSTAFNRVIALDRKLAPNDGVTILRLIWTAVTQRVSSTEGFPVGPTAGRAACTSDASLSPRSTRD